MSDFDAPDDVVVMHYYGVGGWGVQWRGRYLLLAPYFSNHGFLEIFVDRPPNLEAIREGVVNTPFSRAELILVGHGHVDHAGDIPGYLAAGLPSGRAGLIANRTTLNMLSGMLPPNEDFRCARAPEADAKPIEGCELRGFRITPLASAHAPNVVLVGWPFTAAEGSVERPRAEPPRSPSEYLLGDTWAYLIDLLDERGEVVFRIHYMDAAAGADEKRSLARLAREKSVDVHVACVPGYHYVSEYPEWAIEQGEARFVMLGHWEDFFRARQRRLKPVTFVLDERRLNDFVRRVEAAIPSATPSKNHASQRRDDCRTESAQCGPRGGSWALPVPGETFRFQTGVRTGVPPEARVESRTGSQVGVEAVARAGSRPERSPGSAVFVSTNPSNQ